MIDKIRLNAKENYEQDEESEIINRKFIELIRSRQEISED
jgi:hypothetical protein